MALSTPQLAQYSVALAKTRSTLHRRRLVSTSVAVRPYPTPLCHPSFVGAFARGGVESLATRATVLTLLFTGADLSPLSSFCAFPLPHDPLSPM